MTPFSLLATLLLTAADGQWDLFEPEEVEFPFDDAIRLQPGESRGGKVWRSHGLPSRGGPVPLVIFVHGIIFDGLRHHWLTEDPNGPWDARPFLQELVDDGSVTPLAVAVPSQTRDATDPQSLFATLEFDRFVDAVDNALQPMQRVDRKHIVVIGHSAAVCEPENAALAALKSKRFHPYALLALDGCMSDMSATLLASDVNIENIFVGYQDQIWERSFDSFRQTWERTLATSSPRGARKLERFVFASGNAHMAVVEAAARKWLPTLLPPVNRNDRPGGGKSWTAHLRSALAAIDVGGPAYATAAMVR